MAHDGVNDSGQPPRPVPSYSPFQRLARVHAAATTTDAVIAVALAGSIFFSISPDAARDRIALYLALTMAPFALVTPLIGPFIDRMPGGRRAMILVTNVGRLVVALLMIRHIDTLWLFPEAFALLVLQKSYAVAKSAVVPRYVPSESSLVQANSRLALISAVMSLLGAGVEPPWSSWEVRPSPRAWPPRATGSPPPSPSNYRASRWRRTGPVRRSAQRCGRRPSCCRHRRWR